MAHGSFPPCWCGWSLSQMWAAHCLSPGIGTKGSIFAVLGTTAFGSTDSSSAESRSPSPSTILARTAAFSCRSGCTSDGASVHGTLASAGSASGCSPAATSRTRHPSSIPSGSASGPGGHVVGGWRSAQCASTANGVTALCPDASPAGLGLARIDSSGIPAAPGEDFFTPNEWWNRAACCGSIGADFCTGCECRFETCECGRITIVPFGQAARHASGRPDFSAPRSRTDFGGAGAWPGRSCSHAESCSTGRSRCGHGGSGGSKRNGIRSGEGKAWRKRSCAGDGRRSRPAGRCGVFPLDQTRAIDGGDCGMEGGVTCDSDHGRACRRATQARRGQTGCGDSGKTFAHFAKALCAGFCASNRSCGRAGEDCLS